MSQLEQQIKELIISALDLEDVTPDDIQSDEPLFDEGLGLDSIDALELGMALQQTFGVKLNAEDENTREHFRSVASLANFVRDQGVSQEG